MAYCKKREAILAVFDVSFLLTSFATMASAIFIAELTDKDALLLLTLSTKIKPWTAFAVGCTAFTISTAIIVGLGYVLTNFIPTFWIRLAGGVIMLAYAGYEYFTTSKHEIEEDKKKLERRSKSDVFFKLFLSIVSMLIILDLAGDATEVLTIVFVARFQNVLLVFISCVAALYAASALETTLGSHLGKLFSFEKIRVFSLLVFAVIGTIVIATTLWFH